MNLLLQNFPSETVSFLPIIQRISEYLLISVPLITSDTENVFRVC